MSSEYAAVGISIHAPAKGATTTPASRPSAAAFQSTLPRRERQRGSTNYQCSNLFQSTLPRRERPKWIGKPAIIWTISIHAPAKGATRRRAEERGYLDISIHAPAKGATYKITILYNKAIISIHAPAKGATADRVGIPFIVQFQSTLPRRERRPGNSQRRPECNFNPRSREGSDSKNHQDYSQ